MNFITEEKLLAELTFDEECAVKDECYVKFLYQSLLKKVPHKSKNWFNLICLSLQYAKPDSFAKAEIANDSLVNNVDVLTAKAERLYYNCDYHLCYKITSE